MSARLHRRRQGIDIWPGFVDALTSLIMVMIFLLLLFAIGQFVLSDALSFKDRTLENLRAQITQLTQKVGGVEEARASLESRLATAAASLDSSNQERETLRSSLNEQVSRVNAMTAEIQAMDSMKLQQQSQVVDLTKRLDQAALDLQTRDAKLLDLDKQLKVVLASQLSELEKYRSEFFGKLKESLGQREDIKIVGDRFVLPSDVLFTSGSADLGTDAQDRLKKLVATVRDVSQKIPEKIHWVLRVDGHTDRVPIVTDRFPSNWELSTARAVSIVKYMITQGISADHLSANGFGQYQPVDTKDSPESYAKNRRIEFQLTNR